MYTRKTDWNAYLAQRNANQGISKTPSLHMQSIARGNAELLRAAGITPQTLQRGFGAIIANQTVTYAILERGFEAPVGGLSESKGAIEDLRADFNLAMGDILWKLEIQSQKLQRILDVLQAPLDTPAKELRKRADNAYSHGWYDEALRDFLESEQKNYQDFAIHQAIGNIYLYCQQPSHHDQALAYYLKAAKYAQPHSAYYTALAYLQAGFVCYLQRNDQQAMQYAQQATQLYSHFAETWYALAKFAAASRQSTTAIPALEQAIDAAYIYALKVRADGDFDQIETDVAALMHRLYNEAEQNAHQQIQSLKDMSMRWYPGHHDLSHFADLLQQKTYFSYKQALAGIEECHTAAREHTDAILRSHRGTVNFGTIYHLAWHPNSAFLFSCGQSEKTVSWRVATHEKVNTFDESRIVFNPDRSARVDLLSTKRGFENGKQKNYVEIVIKNAKEPFQLEIPRGAMDSSSPTPLQCSISPDGKFLAAGSFLNNIHVWNLINYDHLFRINTVQGKFIAFVPGVNDLCFSPDSKKLVTAPSTNDIRIWNIESSQEESNLAGHKGSILSVAFSPDGKLLASASKDRTIILWDFASGQKHAILQGHTKLVYSVSFHPTGKYLASGSGDKTIRIWEVASGKQLCLIKGHPLGVTRVAFSPDGRCLASGSYDKTVRLWGVASSGLTE